MTIDQPSDREGAMHRGADRLIQDVKIGERFTWDGHQYMMTDESDPPHRRAVNLSDGYIKLFHPTRAVDVCAEQEGARGGRDGEQWDTPFQKRAADALADAVASLIQRGKLDARSPAGDALLDYRDPPQGDPRPLPMILPCPKCGMLHVDAPEPEKGWTNPPHKSHLCHGCGIIWRPADVPTNGVAAITTTGSKDTWKPDQKQEGRGRAIPGDELSVEHAEFLFATYAFEDDAKLTKDAQELKRRLRAAARIDEKQRPGAGGEAK